MRVQGPVSGSGTGSDDHVAMLAATYVVRTPCHGRRVYLDEQEFTRAERQSTLACPRCGRIWVATIPLPPVLWAQ